VLAYDRIGAGEPLVLLHGLGSRREVWAPVVPALAASYDVIAVDLPGFGASPRAHAGGVQELTEAVVDFCAQFDRPHLAGNSMGGGIALELGRRGLARSVTAFSPIGFWHAPGRIWGRWALGSARRLGWAVRPVLPRLMRYRSGRVALCGIVFGRPGRLSPDVCMLNINGILDASGFQAASDSVAHHRFEGALDGLADIPVSIAWGRRDVLLTYATQSRRARAALPGALHRPLPGCGHTPFYDDPAGCADVMIATAARA